MRVVFAYLPTEREEFLCLSQNRFSKFRGDCELIYPVIPASGLTLLKSNKFEVFYIDSILEQLNTEKFIEKLKEINPDLLVYETKTPVVKSNWGIVKKIKRILPEIKIAACGDHVSVLPLETMENSNVDFVITGGDFDMGMLRLAEHLQDGKEMPKGFYYRENKEIKNTGEYELVKDLDYLPFIDREVIPWEKYHEGWTLKKRFMYMMGSRGCAYRCSFCSWPAMLFKYKLRMRSVSKVLDEMEILVNKYKVEEIFFDDDTFTCNKKWVMDFCKGVVDREIKVLWSCNGRVDNTDEEMLIAMKKANCRLIKYGIESANQKTLDRINKGYTIEQIKEAFMLSKKIGILRHGTVMVGYPWESKEDMEKTIKFVKSLDVDTVQFSIPIVYPGTKLFKEAEEKNWLRFGKNWEKYDMSEPSLRHSELSSEEIVKLCQDGWKKVYFQPKFMFRKLLALKNIDQLKWTFRGVKTVFNDIWAIGK